MTQSTPNWLVKEIGHAKRGLGQDAVQRTTKLLDKFQLPTVCQEARCPNRGVCFSNRTATFMILGDTCTRGCRFCAVKYNKFPAPVDENEPERLSLAIAEMGIRHAVITSVTRDDLPDGGAGHYAKTVRTLRKNSPATTIELLIPDFGGSDEALRSVVDEAPDILAHNVDTVARLHKKIKPRANHDRSLKLLGRVKEMASEMVTKSGIMLGLGETAEDVAQELRMLRETGCNMLTLGQYLAPSLKHTAVVRFLESEEFVFWGNFAKELGFESVASGPLVRSSYNASVFFRELS
ncbi:MAG: lipoyl synthase [Desulfomonilaceae bacterium]